MELKFSRSPGIGIISLLPEDMYTADVIDLVQKLLKHHPEDRMSASKALDRAWFKELREQNKVLLQ